MMVDTMPDFSHLFYNIEGDLLSERKKNFQKLLKNPCFKEDTIEIHQALADLKPRNYLEGLFKIDALIHFKKTNQLLEVLEGGNEVYISKLFKQIWFIKEIFGNMSCDEFVNKFLLKMSYTFKIKIIKKMCTIWNEAKHDELFDCIFDRYGLPLAKTVFHKLSAGKINKLFEQYEIKLTTSQEKHLFVRDENLFLEYVLHHNQFFHKYDEQKVIDYVALKNPHFLLELKQKDVFALHHLGRKTTKKIFNIVKDNVLNNVDIHANILKPSVMVRMLGKDFDTVFENKFPNNFHDVPFYSVKSILTFQLLPLYSKNKRWQLFYKTYVKKYPEKDLSEVLSVFDDYIIKLNADKAIIQKWAEIKYKENNCEQYLPYYTNVPEGVTIIKEKINVTSDKFSRIRLVKLLIEACDRNNDLKTLEKVLAYIFKRHRNEDRNERVDILSTISMIPIGKLNSMHWQHIRSLVKITKVQKDIHYYGCIRNLDEMYIEYLIKNNQPIVDAVIEYLEEYDKGVHTLELYITDPIIHSKFIDEVSKLFPKVVKSKSPSGLLNYIVSFSRSNTKHAVDLNVYPHLVEYVRLAIESKIINKDISQIITQVFLYNTYCPRYAFPIDEDLMLRFISMQIEKSYVNLNEIFNNIILKKERSSFENRVFEIFWANMDEQYKSNIGDWFLFQDPKSIVPYFDKISTMSANGKCIISDKAMRSLKYYSHLGFDKVLSEKYKEKVISLLHLDREAVNSAVTIRGFVKKLVWLLSTDDFLILVLKCVPEKDKIDIEDPIMKELYALQVDVISELHNVIEPSKMLSALMTFCVADYLRHALRPLYSIMCRSPEEKIRPCVDILAKRAMSVRKHALCLNTLILDKKSAIMTLKNAEPEDISETKNVFLKTVKYFKKNPSRDLFCLCTTKLTTIDRNDTETLDFIIGIEVPRHYKVEYLERCWIFLEDHRTKDVQVGKYLNSIMTTIVFDDKIVATLSSSFVRKIIHAYFKTDDIDNMELFVLMVLFVRISERRDNFKAVFDILKDVPYKKAYNFVDYFFEFLQQNKEVLKDNSFPEIFYEYWCVYFPLEQSLQEHISLKVLTDYRKSSSKDLFVQYVVDYFEDMLAKYGCLVLDIFKAGLDRLLNLLDTCEKYAFYLNAIKYKALPEMYVLVIASIKNVISPQSEQVLVNVYKELIDTIENANNDICKLHYRYYLVKNS